ncbi:MAG: hypothetical protein ACI3ZZ_06015 [Candidatus Aphodosoma sp.]
MKTFEYRVEYNEQETRTVATIDISETIKAIENKYPGMLAAYRFLTGDIAFSTIKFTGVARLDPRDIPIPNMGRQFAVMKARRKAKKYLKKRFFEIQKAFSKASEDAFNSRLRYDILSYEEDNSIRRLVDNYDGNKRPSSDGYTGEIYIYERGKKYWISEGKINMDGLFYPIDKKFYTKQDVIEYFSGNGGKCGKFSDQKIDFAFLDRV